MVDENTEEAYHPADRADVDKKATASQQRARKYKDGKRLRKKNSQGLLEYDVTIESAEYDRSSHHWLYTLVDCHDRRIDGTTEEKDLG